MGYEHSQMPTFVVPVFTETFLNYRSKTLLLTPPEMQGAGAQACRTLLVQCQVGAEWQLALGWLSATAAKVMRASSTTVRHSLHATRAVWQLAPGLLSTMAQPKYERASVAIVRQSVPAIQHCFNHL